MRISDWSSDVCSSDLIPVPGTTRLSRLAMMQSILELIQEHGLTVVFLNVLFEQAGAPMPAYPILVITGALLDTGAYSAFRSEEHTSELQSLMRISYAVFCLKKKKMTI